MKDFKIIQTWLYHQRVIYLTQIGDKFQMFYRSSGLAGHNSEGNILPHYFLKETKEWEAWLGDPQGGMPFMWLPKIYFQKDAGYIAYYSKVESHFPKEMQKYMNEIRKYNQEVKPDDLPKMIMEDSPFVINDFCREYIKSIDDWMQWGGRFE